MKRSQYLCLVLVFSLFLIGNFCLAASLNPNDTFYSEQWYLNQLNMPEVWAEETGASNVVIAVIDSGVDIDHPDLHNNIWINQDEVLGDNIDNDKNGYIDDVYGWDFIEANNDPRPKYEKTCLAKKECLEEAILHGTFISGIASAVGNNNQGIAGVSWQTKIMPLRVLDENGVGNTYNVIEAVNYAIRNKADIINLSFVGDVYDEKLEATLQKAFRAGLLIIAAAGNESSEGKSVNMDLHKVYPACHQGVNGENIIIGVGSTDKNNILSEYSNYGSDCLDLLAPGDDFFSTVVMDTAITSFDKYYDGDYSGTSLSAPIISGLAALIKSYQPKLTNYQIRDLLLSSTDNVDQANPNFIGEIGFGLINPVKVFMALKSGFTGNRLIKRADINTIYYQAIDGKRYVFPNERTYLSWYSDYNNIEIISDRELAQFSLGGNVTIKPGIYLVKISSDPKVYAIAGNSVLRWVKSEYLAQNLYGSNWAAKVIDIPVAYFVNYKIGEPIDNIDDYNPDFETNRAISIDYDKSLFDN